MPMVRASGLVKPALAPGKPRVARMAPHAAHFGPQLCAEVANDRHGSAARPYQIRDRQRDFARSGRRLPERGIGSLATCLNFSECIGVVGSVLCTGGGLTSRFFP